MELTKTFSQQQYVQALESWSWLDLAGKTPRFTSLFGDIFCESVDGAWWLLDTIGGCLTRPWASRADLAADLAGEEGQDRYLYATLATAAAHRRGLRLGADEVYVFLPPPVLGSGFDVDRIQVFEFVVAVHLAGQLHDQLRDKPPGWMPTEFIYADDQPAPRRRPWKLRRRG